SLEQMVAASPGKTPISLLQEYGTRLGRTPGYDLLKAEGQAHQPNFTFRVTLGDISCTGGTPPQDPWDPHGQPGDPHGQPGPPCPSCSGTSKKLAKRNAAAKMLVRIHNVPMEPRDGSEAEGEEDQFNMTCPRLEGLRGRAPGCTWDSLRNSAGEKLGQLR
ncbi:TRBP2 protein, partial [Copsychus sechellarum]|nr:TRBP2 protein [Copsychus sechellarum]